MKSKAMMAILALALVTGAALVARSHPAVVVVDLIWKHIGGKDNFARARYVSFTWAYEQDGKIAFSREHAWDRYTGYYDIKFKDPDNGDDIEVQFDVDTREGVALRNGTIVEGDAAAELLETAYRAFINDTYWLLAPAKLGDYGVRLQYAGHEIDGEIVLDLEEPHAHQPGEHHDHSERPEPDPNAPEHAIVLHVSFDKVGLTPGDEYWFHVSHEGQVLRWQYKLQSGREGDFDWVDEKDVGMGIILSTRKVSRTSQMAVVFPQVHIAAEVPAGSFSYLVAR